MTKPPVDPKVLMEEALANGGRVSLAKLLAAVVPVRKLRELTKQFGLSPKGGYRIDKAPGYVLAPLLVDPDQTRAMAQACATLAEHLTPTPTASGDKKAAGDVGRDQELLLKRKDQELAELRDELSKSRESATRQREHLEKLHRDQQQDKEAIARRRAEAAQLRRQLREKRSSVEVRDQTVEIHELERELEELSQVESDQRRMLAERQASIRELEERVQELEPLVPKGRRKKKEPPPAPPPLPERFRRPYFTPAFLKSLENKDRRAIEAAYQAALLFCTEGPGYPGLQVKQLDHPIWSFRAALKLRVYFTNREDGDIDILALADRQEQPTVLRRLKEKPDRH